MSVSVGKTKLITPCKPNVLFLRNCQRVSEKVNLLRFIDQVRQKEFHLHQFNSR